MTALDGSVVNISLPMIGKTFNSPIENLEWIVTIYLLILSGLLLGFGRLGDLRGHKAVYMAGFGVFLVSSMLCGLAPSVTFLIIVRGIQALGAAMLAANSPAILTKTFPPEQRGQALGMSATVTYLGLTVGPSLGGWLTSQFSWRAVFYINLPVGLLAIWLSWHYIREDHSSSRIEHFDLAGAITFMTGLMTLLLALNQGHAWGWTSLPILGLLVAATLVLGIFIILQYRVQSPMLDLSLFKSRVFFFSALSAILNYICVYTILFLMPFYLIQGRGFGSAQAGLLLTAQPIIMAIVAPISGTLSDRIGPRIPGIIGMGALTIGLYLLSRLGPTSPNSQVVLALITTGFGTGTFISPNTSALMGAAPRHRQGIAAGIQATARNFGMVLGIGLAGAVFTTVLTNLGGGDTASPALFQAFQTSFRVVMGAGILGIITTTIRER